ncbi:DDB1- and CUL4-associated factor 11-like isoform X2 [Artemia franciscana]
MYDNGSYDRLIDPLDPLDRRLLWDRTASPAPYSEQMANNTLKENDIFVQTLMQGGVHPYPGAENYLNRNIFNLITAREVSPKHGLTLGNKVMIQNEFLPSGDERYYVNGFKLFCGQYSADGNHFLSASQDRNIRLYNSKCDDLKLMKVVRALDVGWSIVDTAFSPDGRQVIYSSWSENIHVVNLWDESGRQEALPLNPVDRRFCVFSLSYSSDGSEILCGATDGKMYIYDLEANQRKMQIHGHFDDINSIAFADDKSEIFFSGSDDGLCKVWDRRLLDTSQSKPVGVFAGHKDGIAFVDSRKDCRYLITNSKDQTIKLWDMRRFSSENAQTNTRKAVGSAQWDYRWEQLPVKFRRYPFSLLEGDTSIMTYTGHRVQHTLIRARFSPKFSTGQRFIYSGCASGALVVYDVLTGKMVKRYRDHKNCVRDVAWHPYKNEIVTSSWDGTMCRYFVRRLMAIDDEIVEITSPSPHPDESASARSLSSLHPNTRRSLRLSARRNARVSNEGWTTVHTGSENEGQDPRRSSRVSISQPQTPSNLRRSARILARQQGDSSAEGWTINHSTSTDSITMSSVNPPR